MKVLSTDGIFDFTRISVETCCSKHRQLSKFTSTNHHGTFSKKSTQREVKSKGETKAEKGRREDAPAAENGEIAGPNKSVLDLKSFFSRLFIQLLVLSSFLLLSTSTWERRQSQYRKLVTYNSSRRAPDIPRYYEV